MKTIADKKKDLHEVYGIVCADMPYEMVDALWDIAAAIATAKDRKLVAYLSYLISLLAVANEDWQSKLDSLRSSLKFEKESNGSYVTEWSDDDKLIDLMERYPDEFAG